MALLRATTRSSGYRTAASRRGETVATCYIVLPTSAQSARAARKQQQWREIDGVIAELRR